MQNIMKKILALVLGTAILFSVSCDKKEVSVNQADARTTITAEDNKEVKRKAIKVNAGNTSKESSTNVQETSEQPKVEQAIQTEEKPTEQIAPAVQPEAAEPTIAEAVEPAVEEPVQQVPEEPVQPESNITENTVEPVVKEEIGSIKNMYEANGKKYIDVDMVEFYRGEEAVAEAEKDGRALYTEDGKAYIYDGYYIRNTDSNLITYEVSSNTEYYLCGTDIDSTSTSSDLVSVSENDFNQFINNWVGEPTGRANLCWIKTSDGIVNCLQKQFTP